MQNGVELIAQERLRQRTVHGFDVTDPANKEFYRDEQLCDAAVQYIGADFISCWPENWGHPYKPTTRISDLAKAGALIAAELDRLLAQVNGGR